VLKLFQVQELAHPLKGDDLYLESIGLGIMSVTCSLWSASGYYCDNFCQYHQMVEGLLQDDIEN
jgi:hypothetical protein